MQLPRLRAILLPIATFLVLAIANVVAWQLIVEGKRSLQQQKVEVIADQAALRLERRLSLAEGVLSRLRDESFSRRIRNDERFAAAAAGMIGRVIGMQALRRIGSDGKAYARLPGDHASAPGDAALAAMLAGTHGDDVSVSPMVSFGNGRSGVLLLAPAHRDGALVGGIVGWLLLDGLSNDTALSAVPQDFAVRLTDQRTQLLARGEPLKDAPSQSRSIKLPGGRAWQLTITPSVKTAHWSIFSAEILALLLGLLLSVCTAVLLAHARNVAGRLWISEQRARDFAEAAADWLWETGPDHRFTHVSDRAVELTGLPLEAFIGRSVRQMIDRDRRDEFWPAHEKTLDARLPFRDFVFPARRNDGGEVRWTRVSGKPHFSSRGRFLGYRGVANDITAQIKMQQDAALATGRLRNVIDMMPAGVALFDADDRMTLYNETYRQLYPVIADLIRPGANFADLLQKAIERGAYWMTPEEAKTFVADRLEQHQRAAGLSEHRLADGRWLQVHERRLEDGGRLGVWADVSEIRRREQALQASEERFQLMTANIPGLVFQATRGSDGLRYIYASAGLRELAGLEPEDLVADSSLVFHQIHPEDRERVIQAVQESAETLQRWHFEFRATDGHGNFKWIRSTAQPRKLANGDIVWDGVSQDITDRKHYEAALKQSEERYALAMRGANEALWHWDIATGEIYMAPRLAEMIGAKETVTLDGGEFYELRLHPQDRGMRRQAMKAHISGATDVYFCEYRLLDGNGEYRWVMDRGLALRDENGRAYRMAGSVGDISNWKRYEADLRAAKEQAEIANRTKSEFLANMSHELRTPLNAIIGFSDIIRNEMLGPISIAKYREYAGDINVSGGHLLAVINDILDMSKIEAGKVELSDELIPVPAVADSAVRLVKQRAEENGVTLICDLPAELPQLQCDARKLKQILLNLLSNGVKFTPSGGKVALSAQVTGKGDMLIRVADTGIGIAAGDIPKALAPFGQVDSRLNRKYEGTGLGLALVQSLMQLHGGSLLLESELGVGTTATLRFPAERVTSSRQFVSQLHMATGI